jgi:hypothetical protein
MYLIYIYLAFQFIVQNPNLFYYGARLLKFSLSLLPQLLAVASTPLSQGWNKINSVKLLKNEIIVDGELVEVDTKISYEGKVNEQTTTAFCGDCPGGNKQSHCGFYRHRQPTELRRLSPRAG